MSGCRCQAVFGERTAFPVKISDLRLRFGLAGRYQRAAEPGRVLFEGRLEKFLSPSLRESDSVTARGDRRMERACHGADRLFRC
jgi:hypothetical protein